MWSQPRLGDVWDWLLLVLLLPVVLLLGLGLPADWAQHNGKALRGSARVTSTETIRGGEVALVELRSVSGEVVARDQEVNGEAPHRVGATFAVDYIAPDSAGNTQIYVAGHDPFATNLLIFALVLIPWTASLALVGRRVLCMISRRRRRGRVGQAQRYSAGRGYIDD